MKKIITSPQKLFVITFITALLMLIGFSVKSQTIPFSNIQKTIPGNIYIAVGTGTNGVITPTASIPISKVTGAISLNSLSAMSPLTYNNSSGSFSLTPLTITNTGSGNAAITGNTLNIPNTTYSLTQAGIYSALTYTPYNSANPSNYITLTGISATSPLFYNSTTGTFSIQPASISQAGVLSSIDWNNFNAKLNSVNGTTNRITSSGGVNPTIDISATFESLLSKIANRIDQNNASTTSAQLATVIPDETGTGVLVYGTGPTISSPTITGITSQSTTTYNGATFEAKGTDIASSATISLGGSTGNMCHITGTTSITYMGVVQAGTMRTTVFDNTLTVTSSTNIILPDATSILTGANDVAIWVSEGSGVWRLIDYRLYSTASLTYAPTVTGFTATPSYTAKYTLMGSVCHVIYKAGDQTSNSTSFTITLPFTADNSITQAYYSLAAKDNGATTTAILRTRINSNIADVYKVSINGAWTASAAKNVEFDFAYIINR